MKGIKYVFTLEEKQAWFIFNEVAKAEASGSLCLPVIFTMTVTKQKDREVSMLSEYISGDNMSVDANSAFKEANVIDFKYILKENHMGELVVPFNVPRVGVTVLVSEELKEDVFLQKRAFLLAFRVDGKVIKRFTPVNIEGKDIEVMGKDVHSLQIDFNTDLAEERKHIVGASKIELMLEINSDHMIALKTKKSVGIVQTLIDKYEDMVITVEFPEDISAKHEA